MNHGREKLRTPFACMGVDKRSNRNRSCKILLMYPTKPYKSKVYHKYNISFLYLNTIGIVEILIAPQE